MRTDSTEHTGNAFLKASEHSLEITGLGAISALLIAFAALVSSGSLAISQYLVFVAFLLVSASGLVWRIFKLSQARNR